MDPGTCDLGPRRGTWTYGPGPCPQPPPDLPSLSARLYLSLSRAATALLREQHTRRDYQVRRLPQRLRLRLRLHLNAWLAKGGVNQATGVAPLKFCIPKNISVLEVFVKININGFF